MKNKKTVLQSILKSPTATLLIVGGLFLTIIAVSCVGLSPEPMTESTQESLPIDPIDPQISGVRREDYEQLRSLLLREHSWREADRKTREMMLKAANRIERGWFDQFSMEQFPCEALREIDQLWLTASNGQFGLSVQQSIWQRVYRDPDEDFAVYHEFGRAVGWYVNDEWLKYENLTFDLSAPRGHLPARLPLNPWTFPQQWREDFDSLTSRLNQCDIQ